MPTIAIYLPDDLYEQVRKNTSKIVQAAFRKYFGMDKEKSLKRKIRK